MHVSHYPFNQLLVEVDQVTANRGDWVAMALTDRAYDIIDVLMQVAEEVDTTPAHVALKWVQSQPGVSSTIVGARTLAQLEDNVAALDVALSADQVKKLSAASEPTLNFPAAFLKRSAAFRSAEITINGETGAPNPLAIQKGAKGF
jgi:diketogulonate reductase-like aldo/keto reductase